MWKVLRIVLIWFIALLLYLSTTEIKRLERELDECKAINRSRGRLADVYDKENQEAKKTIGKYKEVLEECMYQRDGFLTKLNGRTAPEKKEAKCDRLLSKQKAR